MLALVNVKHIWVSGYHENPDTSRLASGLPTGLGAGQKVRYAALSIKQGGKRLFLMPRCDTSVACVRDRGHPYRLDEWG